MRNNSEKSYYLKSNNFNRTKSHPMKIRPLPEKDRPKVYALLRKSFPNSSYEVRLTEALHNANRPMHEWVCIHLGKIAAYAAFTNAFKDNEVIGLHLAPLAVSPYSQNEGIGSELLRFCLRQEAIKTSSIFVLGKPRFYKKFGFEKCIQPLCPFDKNNAHFLSINHKETAAYTVGYEPEFKKIM